MSRHDVERERDSEEESGEGLLAIGLLVARYVRSVW